MAKLIVNKFSGLTYESTSEPHEIPERRIEEQGTTKAQEVSVEDAIEESSQDEEMEIGKPKIRPNYRQGDTRSPPTKKRSWSKWQPPTLKEEIVPVILSNNRRKLAEISPKKIRDAVKQICLPNDKFEIRPLTGGDIIIYPTIPGSTKKLLGMKEIENIEIEANIPNRMKYKRAVIRNVSAELSAEDIILDLYEEGIRDVKFLCKKPHAESEIERHLHTVLLEMDILKIPEKVFLFHQSHRVLKYKEKPLLCGKCLKYGHPERLCAKAQRCRKCKGEHHVSLCTKSDTNLVQCINCGGEHEVENPNCEVRKKATQVIRGKNITKSYRDVVVGNRKREKGREALFEIASKNLYVNKNKEGKERTKFLPKRVERRNTEEPNRKIFPPMGKSVGTQSNAELEPIGNIEMEPAEVPTQEIKTYRTVATYVNTELFPLGVEVPRDFLGDAHTPLSNDDIDIILDTLDAKFVKLITFLGKRNTSQDRAVIKNLLATAAHL